MKYFIKEQTKSWTCIWECDYENNLARLVFTTWPEQFTDEYKEWRILLADNPPDKNRKYIVLTKDQAFVESL